MSILWVVLFFLGIIISFFTGNIKNMSSIILNSTNEALKTFISMSLLIMFWNGIFNIANDSGLISRLAKLLKKPVSKLFPNLDKNSKEMEYVCANLVVNILGIGVAATSLGLKAVELIDGNIKLNNYQKRASVNTFITINVCTLSMFPLNIISIRNSFGGVTDCALVIAMIICSTFAFVVGILLDIFMRFVTKCK